MIPKPFPGTHQVALDPPTTTQNSSKKGRRHPDVDPPTTYPYSRKKKKKQGQLYPSPPCVRKYKGQSGQIRKGSNTFLTPTLILAAAMLSGCSNDEVRQQPTPPEGQNRIRKQP